MGRSVVTTPTARVIVPLTIDYTQSLAEIVEAGRYNYANPNITEENFPTNMGDPEVVGSPTGLHVVVAVLVHLDHVVKSDEVLREMERLGLRPGTMRELTAFGEQLLDIQHQYSIVALGSVWTDPDGDHRVGYLWGSGGYNRRLRLGWFGDRWIANDRFLAVRK